MDNYKSIGNYFYYNNTIGTGSFSNVYKGFRIKDQKIVAIKHITRFIEEKYIHSEISLMKKISHKNIIKLYDVIIKNNKNTYLILEYCDSYDLSNYINSSCKKYNFKYIFEIINGLEYLYLNKILHRDIKPQNILIHKNSIKICDFGFAKIIKDNDLINTFCGSPLYMAPELFTHNQYNDKADIWSLGVIIYEILYKKHPYISKTKLELIKKIKSYKIIYPECKNEFLLNLLKKMLIKNYNNRITWKEIFNDKLYIKFKQNHINKFINIPNKNLSVTLIPKNLNSKIINKTSISEINSKKYKGEFINYEDCKVYSKSAPGRTNYLENYINNKAKKKFI